MITPGTYPATLMAHAISETKAGAPQAALVFSFQADGKNQSLTYFGSFSENGTKHTLKALLVCGLKGNNPAGPLDIGREVSIVVDTEIGQDGKSRDKIKWVNALGATRNVMAPDLAKAKLSALEGAVMAARQDLGIDDEIPF